MITTSAKALSFLAGDDLNFHSPASQLFWLEGSRKRCIVYKQPNKLALLLPGEILCQALNRLLAVVSHGYKRQVLVTIAAM
jgi:hypothetical protein